LTAALDLELAIDDALLNPALRGKAFAVRDAIASAMPQFDRLKVELGSAQDALTGKSHDAVHQASEEIVGITQLAALLNDSSASNKPWPPSFAIRYDELAAHTSAMLRLTNFALSRLGAGPSSPAMGRALKAAQLAADSRYTATIALEGLSFPSAMAVADDGAIYIAEAGFSYGGIAGPARILRIKPQLPSDTGISGGAAASTAGQTSFPVPEGAELIAEGFSPPITGIAWSKTRLFVAHQGRISAVDLDTKAVTALIEDLPRSGDRFHGQIVVRDDRLYFALGTVSNSGIVGLDAYASGLLQQAADIHDLPCRDLTLRGENYTTGNPLTADVTDTAVTGAFLPFGQASAGGQTVTGAAKCNGAILSASLDGSDLVAYADGFHNPRGLGFDAQGRLLVSENGP
jgi:glucose/arabinose dehydrogenase